MLLASVELAYTASQTHKGFVTENAFPRAPFQESYSGYYFFPFTNLIPSEWGIEMTYKNKRTKHRHGPTENKKRRERKRAFSSGVF